MRTGLKLVPIEATKHGCAESGPVALELVELELAELGPTSSLPATLAEVGGIASLPGNDTCQAGLVVGSISSYV